MTQHSSRVVEERCARVVLGYAFDRDAADPSKMRTGPTLPVGPVVGSGTESRYLMTNFVFFLFLKVTFESGWPFAHAFLGSV